MSGQNVTPHDLSVVRESYTRGGLDESDLSAAEREDPMRLFARWYAEVAGAGVLEPNAMTVSTVSETGAPSSRFVLLKSFAAGSGGGFVFYTNYESRKGRELEEDPRIALVFPWHPLERQVRVEGMTARVGREEAEAYWATRPRASQIGSFASPQSEVVDDREELDRLYAAVERRFTGEDGGPLPVPLPPHWGGYRVTPRVVEFWQGRVGRLHDRLAFERDGDTWTLRRLAP